MAKVKRKKPKKRVIKRRPTGGRKVTTTKQKAASRRNLEKARAAKKRGGGSKSKTMTSKQHERRLRSFLRKEGKLPEHIRMSNFYQNSRRRRMGGLWDPNKKVSKLVKDF